MNVNEWIKNNASTILACLGAGGMVASVGLAIKATPAAAEKLSRVRRDKLTKIVDGEEPDEIVRYGIYIHPKLTMLETVQTCWKDYLPTAAVVLGSLFCIFGANVMDRKRQASLISAYAVLESAYRGYKDKIDRFIGPETNEMIEKTIKREEQDIEDDNPPWDEKQTFYLEYSNKPMFFERTMEEVVRAEYLINRIFILRGFVTLNELLEFLQLDSVDGGDDVGWDQYIGETLCGYRWIDFSHRHYISDEGLNVCSIDLPFEPHPLDEDEFNDQFAKNTAAVMET